MQKHLTAEHKAKISATIKRNGKLNGKPLSQEHKDKIGLALKGRNLTEATKAKIGEALKGKPLREEVKLKISMALKNRAAANKASMPEGEVTAKPAKAKKVKAAEAVAEQAETQVEVEVAGPEQTEANRPSKTPKSARLKSPSGAIEEIADLRAWADVRNLNYDSLVAVENARKDQYKGWTKA